MCRRHVYHRDNAAMSDTPNYPGTMTETFALRSSPSGTGTPTERWTIPKINYTVPPFGQRQRILKDQSQAVQVASL